MEIRELNNPWRKLLRSPAKWRGIIFHVETGARTSGRRTVTHEFPKASLPYSEDMGRHARRIHFSGYLIYRPDNAVYEYTSQRTKLYEALEQDGPGLLVHPVFCPRGMQAMCERYTMIENRTRGGFTEFEMMFVEYGTPGNTVNRRNTASSLSSWANDTGAIVKSYINESPTPLPRRKPVEMEDIGVGEAE